MGETFGRYQLIQLAGTGGMAQVHLARRIGSEGFIKPCVLKRIAPEQAHDPEIRVMFMEEARLTALLNHPNVIQTFDYGEFDGVPYLAMELVDGVNLAQLCRTLNQRARWLPLSASVDLVLALLDALDYAHNLTDLDGRSLNLVHRDVSPQNILLARQGFVKLADFGIARHDAREAATIGATVKGKPAYMSPEQAMGAVVDHRADLFSVGIILAELVGARRVLTKKDRVRGLLEVEARVREICRARTGTPPELVEFATSMARLEPAERPATAADAAGALRRIRAAIRDGAPLPDFLRSVFQTYIHRTNEPEASGEASEPPARPTTAAIPAPPLLERTDLEGTAPTRATNPWEDPAPTAEDAEDAAGTASEAVYGLLWPTRFIPEEAAGPLDLVAHASSVEAMTFFDPQFSDELLKRSTEDLAPADTEHGKVWTRDRRLPCRVGAGGPGVSTPSEVELRPSEVELRPPENGPSAAARTRFAFWSPGLEPVEGGTRRTRAKGPFDLLPVLYLMVAGLAVVALGVGILALAARARAKNTPAVPRFGTVAVTSSPAGGRVLIDGRDTGIRTPAELTRLPVDRPMHIAVRMRDHSATPPDVVLRVPSDGMRSTAHFMLRPGRRFRIESTPSGAVVMVNDHRPADVTPVVLPVVPYGETASVSLTYEGYLPGFIHLESTRDTATVAHVRLEPGQHLEISSNPPGADVTLDRRPLGTTPLYDILVPVERRFTLQIVHPAFRPWRKRISGARARDVIVADLQPLQFLSLPWSPAERPQARRLSRALHREKKKIARLSRTLTHAEAQQRRVESSLGATVGDLADVQRTTDLARERLAGARDRASDLASRMDSMRQVLLLRVENE